MKKHYEDNNTLISQFNHRNADAFSEIYTLFYKPLYYYAHSLFKNTAVDPRDIIQEVFLKIWKDRHYQFENTEKLKSLLYISIRNELRMYHNHQQIVDKHIQEILQDQDLFIVKTAEAEIFSSIPEALNLLPEECARTFQLLLEGFEIKEIAQILNKPQSTIYSQRKLAISIILNRLKKE